MIRYSYDIRRHLCIISPGLGPASVNWHVPRRCQSCLNELIPAGAQGLIMACNLSILATLKYFLSGINMYVSFVFAFARDSLPPPQRKKQPIIFSAHPWMWVVCSRAQKFARLGHLNWKSALWWHLCLERGWKKKLLLIWAQILPLELELCSAQKRSGAYVREGKGSHLSIHVKDEMYSGHLESVAHLVKYSNWYFACILRSLVGWLSSWAEGALYELIVFAVSGGVFLLTVLLMTV